MMDNSPVTDAEHKADTQTGAAVTWSVVESQIVPFAFCRRIVPHSESKSGSSPAALEWSGVKAA